MAKKELIVKDHLAYLRGRAERLAKIYKSQDADDLYNEAVLIACEYKHRYDPKYAPTTFLFNQVIRRLNNKIKRELIPSFFQRTETKRGTIPGFFDKDKDERERVFRSFVSLDRSNGEGVELIDRLPNVEFVDLYEEKEFKERIQKLFIESGIKKSEILLLNRRYGLNGERKHKLKELAAIGIMTVEGVRKKINRIIKKLKSNEELRGLAA